MKISLYWKCQLIGWTIASLYWGYIGFTGRGFLLSLALLYFITDVALYILITHAYRTVALRNRWQQLALHPLLKRIIPAILVMGALFMIVTLVKTYWLREWIAGNFISFPELIKDSWAATLMAGIRLMSIWILAYHLYHYAQREIRIVKENARLALITKDAQLNNLSAQLNPHFFFNSLNNIKALIIEDPTAARRAVDLLAELLRSSLYGKQGAMVSITEELNLVRDYLELEKLRMEERLQSDITIDEKAAPCLVPRLGIQTLVENAIKHGLSQERDGGLISIQVQRQEEHIAVTVQHPGTLDKTASQTGLGLANLRERIALQYKGQGGFHITQQERHVIATLKIPVA